MSRQRSVGTVIFCGLLAACGTGSSSGDPLEPASNPDLSGNPNPADDASSPDDPAEDPDDAASIPDEPAEDPDDVASIPDEPAEDPDDDGGPTPDPTGEEPDEVDLCFGLQVDDKTLHPMTPLAKPALGEAVVDPEFGTTIRRISAAPANGGIIKPMYSTVSAWNADESLLILLRVNGGVHELYDGRTYEFIRTLDINPPDVEQVFWHTSDPDILFYVQNVYVGNGEYGDAKLIRYHVASANKEVVTTFGDVCPGKWVNSGGDPVFNTWDSDLFALACSDPSNGWQRTRVFIYRVSTDTVITQRDPSPSGMPPRLGPSGTLTLWDEHVTDSSLNTLRTIAIRNPHEHTSLGQMKNGHDTFNTVIYDPPSGQPDNDHVGSLTTYDLTDASMRVIIGPKTGYPYPQPVHISALTFKNPGWVLVSSADNTPETQGQGLLELELVYADTNTGRVCRIAHHRAWGRANTELAEPYWAEAHAVPSPSGTRVLFGSDWENGTSVDAYVVELPSYQP